MPTRRAHRPCLWRAAGYHGVRLRRIFPAARLIRLIPGLSRCAGIHFGQRTADPDERLFPMSDPRPAGGRNGGRLLGHIAVVIGIVAVAAAAFVLSYNPVRDIALSAGVPTTLARLYPAIFDAVLVVACAASLTLRDARWWTRWYAWLAVLLMVALIGSADASHAMGYRLPHKIAAGTIAAIPWALVMLGFSLWLSMLRHARTGRAGMADGQQPGRLRPGYAERVPDAGIEITNGHGHEAAARAVQPPVPPRALAAGNGPDREAQPEKARQTGVPKQNPAAAPRNAVPAQPTAVPAPEPAAPAPGPAAHTPEPAAAAQEPATPAQEPAAAAPEPIEPIQAEEAQGEPAREEPPQAEPAQAEPAQAEPPQAEPPQAEPALGEPARAEPEPATSGRGASVAPAADVRRPAAGGAQPVTAGGQPVAAGEAAASGAGAPGSPEAEDDQRAAGTQQNTAD